MKILDFLFGKKIARWLTMGLPSLIFMTYFFLRINTIIAPQYKFRLIILVILFIVYCAMYYAMGLADGREGIQKELVVLVEREETLLGYTETINKQTDKLIAQVEDATKANKELLPKLKEQIEATKQKLSEYEAMTKRIDPTDERILELIRRNPDYSDRQIGQNLNLSRQAVNVRRKKLEAMGYKVR